MEENKKVTEEIELFEEPTEPISEVPKVPEVPKEEPAYNEVLPMSKDNEIVQSNALVEGCYSLSDVEQRVLFALISNIDDNDKSLKRMAVQIKDLADMCDLTQKNAYTQIDAVCDNLITKAVIHKVTDRNGKRSTDRHPWFIELNNKEVSGLLYYQFHNKLKNELLELKKLGGYVSVKQNVVNKLETSYAIRLYILFLKWLKIGHLQSSIENLVELFQLHGKYLDKRTKKLNVSIMLKRVIYPALEKINNTTKLKVGYELTRLGKSITGIIFRFQLNNQPPQIRDINLPPAEESKEWTRSPEVAKACNRLFDNGFSKALFNKILIKFDNKEDFQAAVATALDTYATEKNKAPGISNPGGFLYTAIMNYDPDADKIFAAEAAAEKEKIIETERKTISSISNAKTWEDIIALAADQTDKAEAVKIMQKGKTERPELFSKFEKAYRLTYPNNDGYNIEYEITMVTMYGVEELKKTPKVNYNLKEEPINQ